LERRQVPRRVTYYYCIGPLPARSAITCGRLSRDADLSTMAAKSSPGLPTWRGNQYSKTPAKRTLSCPTCGTQVEWRK
jgi:hypothetical protein